MRGEDPLLAAWQNLLLTLGAPGPYIPPAASRRTPIPTTLFTGFLGAGKTTLLCQLLADSSLAIAAIVNDVASVNIDGAAVRRRNVDTIEFQNGCTCCVLGSDLRNTLDEIGARDRRPDAIVVEASGVADPVGIAGAIAQSDATTLDGIVNMVDATDWQIKANDPVIGPLFRRQLESAHLVVVTKSGLGDVTPIPADSRQPEQALALTTAIGNLVPGRPVMTSENLAAAGLSGILLGAATRGARPAPSTSNASHAEIHDRTLLASRPIEPAPFFSWLDNLPPSVYRVKGWLWVIDAGKPPACLEIQAVGRRWRASPSDHTPGGSQIVVIGHNHPDLHDWVLASNKLGLEVCDTTLPPRVAPVQVQTDPPIDARM